MRQVWAVLYVNMVAFLHRYIGSFEFRIEMCSSLIKSEMISYLRDYFFCFPNTNDRKLAKTKGTSFLCFKDTSSITFSHFDSEKWKLAQMRKYGMGLPISIYYAKVADKKLYATERGWLQMVSSSTVMHWVPTFASVERSWLTVSKTPRAQSRH